MNKAVKPDPNEWRSPTVVLIGLGTGKDDLSVKVLQWLDRAEVLAGGKRHLDSFPDFGGERILVEAPLSTFFEHLKHVSERKRTAVLASGDPLFFGIGRRLIKALGSEHIIAFPNITSVQALFARLGESWEDVRVLSLHGGPRSAQAADWLQEVRSHSRVALLTDPQHHPGWVARQLLDAGMGDRSLIVAEDLGLPSENIQHMAPEEALDQSFSPLNLVLVTAHDPASRAGSSGAADRGFPVLGLPDSAFEHDAGMITKMEVRAVVLAHLQLKPGLTLWDLGAGSGSVSIEAARMAQLKQVVAVEKNRGRYEALKQNVKNLDCPEIQVVHGKARDLIPRFPDPDRVFIGGGGDELRELLQLIRKRLRTDGRVVQTVVTLDTLETVRSFWRSQPFEMSIVQLQVSRSAAIGESLRFEALNPVFIVTVWPR